MVNGLFKNKCNRNQFALDSYMNLTLPCSVLHSLRTTSKKAITRCSPPNPGPKLLVEKPIINNLMCDVFIFCQKYTKVRGFLLMVTTGENESEPCI